MKFILLFIVLPFLLKSAPNCPALVETTDCDFYKECMEAKFQCGPEGYPLGYGGKYCNKFSTNIEKFPLAAQNWIKGTLVCLKTALLPIYNKGTASCPEVHSIAFESHPRCYVENGFCELFARFDVLLTVKALLQVFELKDFKNKLAIQQIIDTGKICGGKIFEIIKKAFAFINGFNAVN